MTPTLKTIHNFRDCGGGATVDGRHLRLGRVYRSGTLDDAQATDLRILHILGLKTIIDLRAPREKKKPPAQVDGTRRVDIPIELETRTREKIQPLMTKRGAEQEVVNILKQMYHDLADEVWPQAGQLFKVLLNAEAYPVLIHCRAGKDRTGFMCAQVVQAVRGTVAGKSFVDPLVAGKVLNEVAHRPTRSATLLTDKLTEREVDVLRLLAQGLSNTDIAARLYLSEGTVRNHVSAIFTKLNVADRTQAAVIAIQHGLGGG